MKANCLLFYFWQCGNNSRQNSTMMLEEVGRYDWEHWRSRIDFARLFIFLFWYCDHILKELLTNYRVLKDKGIYILVIFSFTVSFLQNNYNLDCIWSAFLIVILLLLPFSLLLLDSKCRTSNLAFIEIGNLCTLYVHGNHSN